MYDAASVVEVAQAAVDEGHQALKIVGMVVDHQEARALRGGPRHPFRAQRDVEHHAHVGAFDRLHHALGEEYLLAADMRCRIRRVELEFEYRRPQVLRGRKG